MDWHTPSLCCLFSLWSYNSKSNCAFALYVCSMSRVIIPGIFSYACFRRMLSYVDAYNSIIFKSLKEL